MDPEKKLYIGLASGTALLLAVLAVLSVLHSPVRLLDAVRGAGLDRWAWDHLLTTDLKVKLLSQEYAHADEHGPFPRFGLGCGGELIRYSGETVVFVGGDPPVLALQEDRSADLCPLDQLDAETYVYTSAAYPIRLLIRPTLLPQADHPVACLEITAEVSRVGP